MARRFDHDYARKLYADGWKLAAIAREVGVSAQSIRAAVLPPKVAICSRCGIERSGRYLSTKDSLCLSCSKTTSITRNCKTCGVLFEIKACYAEKLGRGRFCSPACYYKSAEFKTFADRLSSQRRGSGNPAFRTGRFTDPHRARRGWGLSEKGESVCRVCGSHEWVQLHHAIPRSKCRAARDDLRNGLPLCASCHQRWHKHSLTISREVFTDEEWSYLSSVSLTGELIGPWLDKHYPESLKAVA